MKFALNTVKTTVAAVALAAASTAATAATEFNFNDKIVLGYPSVLNMSKDGIGLTVTGYRGNGTQAFLDVDFLRGLGVVSGLFFGLPTDSTQLNGSEYLVFKFDQAVTLVDYLLCDNKVVCPESSLWKNDGDRFSINNVNLPTDNRLLPSGFALGPVDTFVFRTVANDAYRIKSVTVTPVPEPEAIAMMLAGLGVVGFVAARRKKAA
ncbi:MAG: PEP-CTERM sorting domain-containing protein [Aquabacterium sp.]